MKKIFLLTCVLFSILSCSKQQTDPATSSDVRDKFVGVWARAYTSKCKAGTSNNNGTFTISKSTSKSDAVILNYGLDGINKPDAIISNNQITFSGLSVIPFSTQSGSGTISSDGKTINVTGVDDQGAYVGVCTTVEVWTKK